jgi:hypothetical protein
LHVIYDDGIPAPLPPTPFNRGRPQPPRTPPTLIASTENISALTLRLGDAGITPATMPPLSIDGTVIVPAELGATVHLARSDATWRVVADATPSPTSKHHGMQGPIGDALTSPFLAVYGDAPGDRALAIAELDAIRNPATRLVIHGEFPMKPASAVTADDIATKNLLLFGSVATHPLLRRYAPQLPAALMDDPGVIFIHPNPENPARYVVVWTAPVLSIADNMLRAGYIQPINLLPDYVRVHDGAITDAGHFSNNWSLSTVQP